MLLLFIIEINRFFTRRHSIYSQVKGVKYFASEAGDESEHRLRVLANSEGSEYSKHSRVTRAYSLRASRLYVTRVRYCIVDMAKKMWYISAKLFEVIGYLEKIERRAPHAASIRHE